MYVSGVVVFHGDTRHQAPCLAFAVAPPAQAPGGALALKDSELPLMQSLPENFTRVQEALEKDNTKTHVRKNLKRAFMLKRSGGIVQVA